MAQWYEKTNIEGMNISGRQLEMGEKAAMYDYQGTKAKYNYLRDGRACWTISARPRVPAKSKCKMCTIRQCNKRCMSPCPSANGIKCRKYNLALVYDNDHPKVRYGSSVKTYPLSPTISELQEIVNKTPGLSPKKIPHLLPDANGELYLCSADRSDVSTSLDSSKGVTSAATSLRFALRWINIFEAGLLDHDGPESIWAKFQRHGEI